MYFRERYVSFSQLRANGRWKKKTKKVSIYRGINIGVWQTRSRLMLISRDTYTRCFNQYLYDLGSTFTRFALHIHICVYDSGWWINVNVAVDRNDAFRCFVRRRERGRENLTKFFFRFFSRETNKLLNFSLFFFFFFFLLLLLLLLYFPYRAQFLAVIISYGLISIDLYSENGILFTPL